MPRVQPVGRGPTTISDIPASKQKTDVLFLHTQQFLSTTASSCLDSPDQGDQPRPAAKPLSDRDLSILRQAASILGISVGDLRQLPRVLPLDESIGPQPQTSSNPQFNLHPDIVVPPYLYSTIQPQYVAEELDLPAQQALFLSIATGANGSRTSQVDTGPAHNNGDSLVSLDFSQFLPQFAPPRVPSEWNIDLDFGTHSLPSDSIFSPLQLGTESPDIIATSVSPDVGSLNGTIHGKPGVEAVDILDGPNLLDLGVGYLRNEEDRSPAQRRQSDDEVNSTVNVAPPAKPSRGVSISITSSIGQSTPVISKKPGRRGPFKNPEEREQTGLTRKIGACLRCRMQKGRCLPDLSNPRGMCMTCKIVTETAIHPPICFRKKVTEAKLFTKGNHPQYMWSRRWNSMKVVNITDWATPEVKTIYVTQDVANLSYPLRVRLFVPQEGDSLRRIWKTKGVDKSYQCNNYAIEDMIQAGRNIVKFVDRSIEGSIHHYIDQSDWLLCQTYLMALKYSTEDEVDANERELVRATLRLWVSVRMESKSERIIGTETLGHKPQDYDPDCHNYGQILLPPVMSAQIELIATANLLEPSRKAVLVPLRKLIEANKTRSWFTVYLCLFILLHSCALLTEFENKQARKYGKQTRYVYGSFVKELHHGSTILLSYFHYCNKGSHPLLIDWKSSGDVHLAELNDEQMEFLRQSSKHVREKAAHFKIIREKGLFEDPYFFLAQLYDPNWGPIETI